MARREVFGTLVAVVVLLLTLVLIVTFGISADQRDRTVCENSGGTYQKIGRVKNPSSFPTFMVVYGCVKSSH